MNRLPLHRSAQLGRTFDRSWSPSDFDPVDRPSRRDRWAGRALAICIGAALGALLIWELAQ